MVKNLPAMQETQVEYLGWEDSLEREWLPTPVLLPEESPGQRSLVGYSPWSHKKSDMTEQLTLWNMIFYVFGEGNGNPLQYSSLGNTMDRGAWQSTAHAVAESATNTHSMCCLNNVTSAKCLYPRSEAISLLMRPTVESRHFWLVATERWRWRWREGERDRFWSCEDGKQSQLKTL